MIGHVLVRLVLWFLLTADFSGANIVIGLCIALLLPRSYTAPETLREWLRSLKKILMVIPAAYQEAFEIMLHPHRHETIVKEQVPAHRSPRMIFLDIFLITFTPKTIVTKHDDRGWYEVHHVRRDAS